MAVPIEQRLTGVVSGLVVWAVWFVAVYALTGVGCERGWSERGVPGGNLLSFAMLASTAVALGLIAWCARRGYTAWRRGADGRAPGREAQQRLRFLGLVMLVLSLLAAAGTVMGTIPMLMLDPCAV